MVMMEHRKWGTGHKRFWEQEDKSWFWAKMGLGRCFFLSLHFSDGPANDFFRILEERME